MGGSSQPFGGTRSTFGDQSSSRRRSAPSFGFGSGTREGREKVFVSQEHAAVSSGGTRSPGPAVYTQKSAVGGQVSSSARSAPQWAFGTSQRWMTNAKSAGSVPGPGTYDLHAGVGTQVSSKQSSAPLYGFGSSTRDHQEKVFIAEEHNKSLYGTGSPGPMMYNLPSSVGKQVNSRTVEQPSWVFGSAKRFVYDHVKRAATSPGPGSYTQIAAVGIQASSTKPSTPRFGFGSSNREHMAKVYISPDHEKVTGGRDAPGPGAYAQVPSTGQKQPMSNVHTAASWGFGTAERFNKVSKQSGTPGPGTYVI